MKEPHKFQHIHAVTFFGWSESHPGDIVYEAARDVAYLCAKHDLTVVSGGFGGEMEAAAKGAKEAGGRAIGVTFYPTMATHFESWEQTARFLDKEIRTSTYLERTLKLVALGDAFICFNGGTGTLSEWGMAWGLARIYYGHHKPVILYGKFWEEIVGVIIKHMHIRPEEKLVYQIVSSPHEALQALKDFDREYRGSHPHYELLAPEKPFII